MIARLGVIAVAVGLGCGGSKKLFVGPQLESIDRVVDVHYPAIPLRLDNGVVAFLLPDPASSLVRVDARYRVGADADTTPGIAHLAEHLSYASRQAAGAPTIAQRLDRASVTYNAYTSWESTHYMAIGAPASLPELLGAEADRLARPCEGIEPGAFELERDVVRNEIRSRHSVVEERFREALYPAGHRRRIVLGGREDELGSLALEAVCGFMRRHYTSENLVLVVSGAFERAAVEALLRERFAAVPAAAGSSLAASPWPRFGGALSEIELPISSPALLLAFPAPSPGDAGEVVARLNASAMTAFASDLDDDHEWIEGVYAAEIEGGNRPLYIFLIEVADKARIAKAREAFFAARNRYIERLGRTDRRFDPTVVVLDDALQERRRELIRAVESLGGRALTFADQLQFAGHPHGVTRELRTLSALTREQVIESASGVLAPSRVFALGLIPGGDEQARRSPSLGPMMRRFDLEPSALAADGAAASTPLKTVPIPSPAVLEQHLDNGVRVLMATGARVPLLDARVVFRHPGSPAPLARASAELLSPDFDREYTYEQVQTLWATLKMGGRLWTSTTSSSSTFRLSGLAAYRDGLLWRLGWQLETGTFPGEAVSSYNRRAARERSENRAWRRIWAAVYGADHPRAQAADAAVSGERLRDFRRRAYRSSAATLIVVGALDRAAVDAQIARVFGRWRQRGPAPRPAVASAPIRRSKTLVFAWPDTGKAQLEVTVLLATTAGSAEQHARRLIAADMLEQELSSIRRELGASYGFSVVYRQQPSTSGFWIRGELAVERSGAALARLVESARGFASETPARRSQLVRARRRVVLDAITDMGHPAGLARQLEHIARFGLPVDYWQTLVRAAAALTIGAMLGPSAGELDLARAVIVLRGPRAAVESAARSLGEVTVERIARRQ